MSVWAADWNLCTMVSAHWDIPGLLLVSIHHQQPVWDGLTVTCNRYVFYEGVIITAKSYRLFWGGFVTGFLLLFAGHWWAGPGVNWVGILIFCVCVSYHVILEMEDTHHFSFIQSHQCTRESCLRSIKKGEYSKLGVTKDKTFHRSFVILGEN